MKCIKNVKTGDIKRVDDLQASNLVGVTWQYIPKSEWKAATRVVSEKQEVETEGGYEDVYVGKEVMKIALNVHEEWYYGKHEDVNNAYYVPDKSKYKIVKGIIL